jgi:alpha-L-arabinofuranosidase
MTLRHWRFGWVLVLLAGASGAIATADDLTVKVPAKPLHDGRIRPTLFGNFIELLDDLAPGMRAEMLNDRGFEGVVPAANWVYFDGSPTLCDREWDKLDDWAVEKTGAFNGSRCARLMVKPDRPAVLAQSGLAVTVGEAYCFSAYMRAEGDVRLEVALAVKRPDGSLHDLATASPEKPAAGWAKVTGTLKPTGTTDRAIFQVRVRGEGKLWVDQVSLMPEANRQGWRADVVEAIKASRPALIRWGGSAVDPGKYRWQDGIGDRDRRPPFRNEPWGRIDTNEVGIGEFCQFCELVVAEPLVCVSFNDGPASAAALVGYCNGKADTPWGTRRAADGHPAPYRVKYWQLGNELSGDDDAYIKKCTEFVAAMKAVDPGISLLSSFPSPKVFAALGKDLSHVAPHHYTRDLAACERDFLTLANRIKATPDGRHLRVAVTEWNFTAGDWGLGRGKMLTLEGALWNAQYLNLMCKHADVVDLACRSNLANSYCSGIIGTTPAGLVKRPSYYVMKLYADHFKPVPVFAGRPAADLDVLACTDEKREGVSVFAVNLRHEPARVRLDLTAFGDAVGIRSAEAVLDVQDRRQPDVMNHFGAPERVKAAQLKFAGNTLTLPALSACAIECGWR